MKKLHKQRREAAKIYSEQSREDLAKDENFQAGVIEAYLQEQMGEDEIAEVIVAVISQLGAVGPQDMGKVMGAAMARLKGKADGSLISTMVKSKLNS